MSLLLNHNGGYQIQGNPTIVNGVVSGFSSSDYLICNQTKTECSSFEKQIKFTTGTIGTFQAILGTMQKERYDGLFIRSDGKLNCTLSKAGGGSQDNVVNYVLAEYTTYIVYLQLASSQLLVIIKNAAGEQLHSQTFTFIVNNQELANVSFGRRFTTKTNSFTGSIDLNSTYIQVNGITWFNGKETASSTVNEVYYNKNCGYTVVGSPTIVNGVVSGFSTDDYLDVAQVFDSTKPFKIHIKVNSFSATNSSQYIFGLTGDGPSLGLYLGGTATGMTFSYGGSYWTQIATNLTIGNPLTVDLVSDGTNLSITITQGAYTKTSTKTLVDLGATGNYTLRIGKLFQAFTSGSIDLNFTFIKVKDITFFNGKETANPAVNTVKYNGTTIWTRSV